MRKIFGYTLIIISLALVIGVWYLNSIYSNTTRNFSKYDILASTWVRYKMNYLNPDGRIIDPGQNNITTSEGQSYALLRSVWSDDRKTFDFVLKWTKNNMKRPNDSLFGWRWGKNVDGSYGFISPGGDNSASDADSDIAFALILAARRWNDNSYIDQALPIIQDLWKYDTAITNGKRYLIGGNWADDGNNLTINPSYFSPYEWRVFAKIDTTNDWNSLISPAYELLQQSSVNNLNTLNSIGLPPDWVAIDDKTGEVHATTVPQFTTNYSYDALRIPWRINLDYQWNHEQRAKQYLTSAFSYLDKEYKAHGKLAASYTHDGKQSGTYENPALYGALLGAFLISDQRLADKLYQDKLLKLYSTANDSFIDSLGYYNENWVWFGIALYNKSLSQY